MTELLRISSRCRQRTATEPLRQQATETLKQQGRVVVAVTCLVRLAVFVCRGMPGWKLLREETSACAWRDIASGQKARD